MLRTPHDFSPLLSVPTDAHTLPTTDLVFHGDTLLVRSADLATPEGALLQAWLPASTRWLPVGLLGGRYHRVAWVEAATPPDEAHGFRKLRSLFGGFDDPLMAIAGRAYQIAEWDRTHRFCGACGAPTELLAGERCARCTRCGHSAYPRISPAMMVLVKKGDAILLAKHTRLPTSLFTALAGFLEAGESIEDAIHREVREEVGLEVRDLRYFSSQSWPFPHSLMIAFTAEYAGGEIRVDETEIAEARWFGPQDAFPETPKRGLSISAELIHANHPRRP